MFRCWLFGHDLQSVASFSIEGRRIVLHRLDGIVVETERFSEIVPMICKRCGEVVWKEVIK